MYQRYIKRLLDIIISLAALVLLAPVLIVVAVLVRKARLAGDLSPGEARVS